MKVILYLLRRSRSMLIMAVIAGVVSGASSTGLLALINTALTGKAASQPRLLAGFIGLCVLVPVSRVISELLLATLGQDTILQLRVDLSRKILSVPLRRLEELGPHRLLSTLTDDVPTITNVVGLIPTLCMSASILVGGLAYLGYLSWQVLLAVLAAMGLGVLSYQAPILRAVRHLRAARESNDQLHGHFRALTDGAKELKLHSRRRSAFLDEDLQGTARTYRDRNIDGMKIYTIANSWGQLLVFVVIGLLLFALPRWISITSATLTGYTLVLLYLMTPLQTLMNAVPPFGRANVAMARLQRTGLELDENARDLVAEAPPLASDVDGWERVELAGVTHVYRREGEEKTFRLGPIDLTVHRGELLFIAGGNGSGKTTLGKLLAGLYHPDEGEIRLDGVAVDDDNRQSYREMFSAVFSDFYLFSRFLGLSGSDLDAQARHYLAELNLDRKVTVEDGRLSTIALSQGQRKRLALLTAWLEDRPIYLFDEWAADQDPVFKEIFYRQLLPGLKQRGKAVVVISHDDRYYEVADRTIKLENGKLLGEMVTLPRVEPIAAETGAG